MPSDGVPYPIFSYAALVPWTFFANGLAGSTNSLVGNANLIKKVYFPRLAIPLATILSDAFDFAIAFVVLLLMMLYYGIAPTANLNPERKFPSMFEPIHGSAFDITGKGVANPIATFWTAAMMLEHLGEPTAAARLMRAIERTTEEQVFTPDLGGVHDTRAVTQAVLRAL